MNEYPTIAIAGRTIGEEFPCYIIAEACDNHFGSLERAFEMVRQARSAGCDAIKFQHHLPDAEMLPVVPLSDNFDIPLYEFLQRYSLAITDHEALLQYCNEIGIQYLCTPFSIEAALELNEIGVEAYKIGSGELTDIPTLRAIARLGKPMILSTGMAEWSEIDDTIKILRPLNPHIALLNCVSKYPASPADINLDVIHSMKERYSLVVGHSDHTPAIWTALGAVALGASIIEKHFTLDKCAPGPDSGVSIDPSDFTMLVEGIRQIEAARGSVKQVHIGEEPIRQWARRSVVSLVDISAGEIIAADMIWTKRPGTGIPSREMENVIGRMAVNAIPANSLIQWSDLEP